MNLSGVQVLILLHNLQLIIYVLRTKKLERLNLVNKTLDSLSQFLDWILLVLLSTTVEVRSSFFLFYSSTALTNFLNVFTFSCSSNSLRERNVRSFESYYGKRFFFILEIKNGRNVSIVSFQYSCFPRYIILRTSCANLFFFQLFQVILISENL